MIQLKYLCTGYGRHTVARNINATLNRGQLVALLGSNGTGKSTLLKTISAFLPPLAGDVIIDGTSIRDLNAEDLSFLISVVLTERVEVRGMTVRELVSMGRSPYSGFFGRLNEEDQQHIDEALRQVGITALQRRPIATLSDGERQKAMIAKALAQQTPIILLDEPTAFLDFPSKVEMMRLLKQLAHDMKKAILLSTHDVEMALQLSDLLWLMDAEGITIDTPEVLAREGSIEQFFRCEGISFDRETKTFRI